MFWTGTPANTVEANKRISRDDPSFTFPGPWPRTNPFYGLSTRSEPHTINQETVIRNTPFLVGF